MKKFRSILLSLILVLALCVGITACQPAETKYTLSFDMGGHGTQVASQTLGAEDVPTTPENPSEEGWRFDGWFTDNTYSIYFNFGNKISKNTTAYAKWTQAYTVSFDTKVSDLTVASKQVVGGEFLQLPDESTMVSAGKKFEGWYYDATYLLPFNANTAITNSITIYAKWSDYFKVTFDRNGRGAANRVPEPQEYTTAGSKATDPGSMTVANYKFLGWSDTQDGSSGIWNFDTVLTQSITLYAQWARVYRVSIDLNNSEAMQVPPADQSVLAGETAVRPIDDPVLDGYKFDGWYVDAAGTTEFDFATTPINVNTVIYAKWTETKVGTLDVETPEYTYREEAPFGERPDLEGYLIDGKMGEVEGWEAQNWFSTTVTDAPTITMKVSTQFSEKGLYLFMQVEDNGGLYMDGKNWRHKNSYIDFRISDGTNGTSFSIDTLSLYPTYNKVKVAINIAEGEVNTANAENKRAVFNVEMFITWNELRIPSNTESVKVFTCYKYKRIASDNIKYSLTTPFTDPNKVTINDYIDYNANGYIKVDAPNATLGSSSLGVAKTNGWDIAHESDDTNAYVSSSGVGTQAIFYKGIVDTKHYMYEFEVDGAAFTTKGKAGSMIYSNANTYAMVLYQVDTSSYDRSTGKFLTAKPYIKVTDKDGKLVTKVLDEVDVSAVGRIKTKIVFSDSYIYVILNDVLIHCEFVAELGERTNPGLCTIEGGVGIRFKDYTAQILTSQEARSETAKYAYVISKGKLNSLNINLSTTGVSSNPDASKKIVMDITNTGVALTTSQRNSIYDDGVVESGVRMYRIKDIVFTVNNVAHSIIDAFTDPVTGAKWGQFTYEYPFEGDAVITNTTELIPVEELTSIAGNVVDYDTGNPVAATAIITSNNPRLGRFEAAIVNGKIAIAVPKGYDYKITIRQTGYRDGILDVIEDVNSHYVISETVRLVPNILGGTAVSRKSSFSMGSSTAGWDMTNEQNNEIIFETTGANPPTVFFSGYTIHNYQYAKVSVSNVTDINAYTNYENDPAIGFQLVTKTKKAFIGLWQKGLRYLHDQSYWGPKGIQGYSASTCNHIDPTGAHKDTLEIIRIDRSLYSWINGTYMGCIILDDDFEKEAAIGVHGTFSYYGKIVYKDYEIKVGDEAVEIAKQKVGLTLQLEDSMYAIDEDTWDYDYNKPLVSISGLNVIEKDDRTTEELALAGNDIVFTRTEYAADDEIYTVQLGTYGSVILSKESPTGKFTIPGTAKGVAVVSLVGTSAATVTGKFVSEDPAVSGPFNGKVVLTDGSILNFTSGMDGTFAVSVPVNATFTVYVVGEGLVAPGVTTKAPSRPSGTKDIGEIEVYKSMLGGKVAGTQVGSATYGWTVGYDNDDSTVYEGEYVECEPNSGNFNVAINTGTFGDFDLTYSLVRFKYEDRANESDPGFGIQVNGGGSSQQILFYRNGVRCIGSGGFAGRTEKVGLMGYDTASSFNVPYDFRIIRRGGAFIMLAKAVDATEWSLVHIQESEVAGDVAILLQSTNSKSNHYVFWNVNVAPLSDENLPEELIKDVTVNLLSGDNSGTVTLSGGSVIDGQTKYVSGDTVVVTIKPNKGYVLAYAKVNGVAVAPTGDKLNVVVKADTQIDIFIEPQFMTYTVTGKVVVDTTYMEREMPKSVNIYAYFEDGRAFSVYDVLVDNDGSVSFDIREGQFKMYAYTDTLVSAEIDATISETETDFGTLTLQYMRGGNVTVNGTTVKTSHALNEANLSKGMINLPGTKQNHCWMPESKAKGDFVFSTDVVQTGGADSDCYANDHVAGIVFTNGTATFSIQFWSNGFRISDGYWNTAKMMFPKPTATQYFSDTLPAGETRTHNLAVKRVGTSLLVYVDGVHTFSFSVDKGFEWASGVSGSEGYPANANAVKELYASVFGNADSEIAIGFRCSLMNEGGSYINKTGFTNIVLTDKADLISSFNGKF